MCASKVNWTNRQDTECEHMSMIQFLPLASYAPSLALLVQEGNKRTKSLPPLHSTWIEQEFCLQMCTEHTKRTENMHSPSMHSSCQSECVHAENTHTHTHTHTHTQSKGTRGEDTEKTYARYVTLRTTPYHTHPTNTSFLDRISRNLFASILQV